MKNFKDFWSNDEGFSYVEVIIICVLIAVILLLTIPNQIKKMNEAKWEIDRNHANIIGNAIDNLLITDESFKDYTVERLNLNEDPPSHTMDQTFLSSVKQELKLFHIERIPKVSYKKGTYKYFSVTVTESKVYVYVDSGGDKVLQLYPTDAVTN